MYDFMTLVLGYLSDGMGEKEIRVDKEMSLP